MARLTLINFVREQWSTIPPLATANLAGKTVVVVGANTGLGFEASKHFARMNPKRLIMACRNPNKGEAAVGRLKRETGFEAVELWIIDLANFSSVSEFSREFDDDGGRLDILVQNAGIQTTDHQETSDGWEITIQVNNLSLPLLALLLLPRMVETGREHGAIPRLVVVASEVHYWANLEKAVLEGGDILRTLSSKEYCTPEIMARRYFDSKLLNIFFMRALNDRLPKSPGSVIVNGVNPGYCYTNLGQNLSGVRALLDWFMERLLSHTAEEGSRQLVWASVGGAGTEDELRGAYISRSEIREVSDFVLTEDGMTAQNNIWDEVINALVRLDSRVQKRVENYLVT
ncbi:short-chain dehydrogenase [Collybia nuda]|uniref:Short-chain dehydrogenase n=1 Tax=Collybia nuda TaxID=64659 RepID=A0A9P6CCE3_9AGAR|nr:short-chain dehydrogenase [Collybia nuda]